MKKELKFSKMGSFPRAMELISQSGQIERYSSKNKKEDNSLFWCGIFIGAGFLCVIIGLLILGGV